MKIELRIDTTWFNYFDPMHDHFIDHSNGQMCEFIFEHSTCWVYEYESTIIPREGEIILIPNMSEACEFILAQTEGMPDVYVSKIEHDLESNIVRIYVIPHIPIDDLEIRKRIKDRNGKPFDLSQVRALKVIENCEEMFKKEFEWLHINIAKFK